jgi:hypothetical protein
MKVFLTYNDVGPIGYKKYSLSQLNRVCDGECYEIYLDDFVINSFPIDDLSSILDKVAINGTIIIPGVDIDLFARDLVWFNLSYEGKQRIMKNVKNAITWKEVKTILLDRGFSISRIELNGYEFIIEAKRD